MTKLNFNDHLDDMMERLMDEDIKPEDLDKEVKRAKALCQLADRKIKHNETVIKAAQLISSGEVKTEFLKTITGEEKILKITQNQTTSLK